MDADMPATTANTVQQSITTVKKPGTVCFILSRLDRLNQHFIFAFSFFVTKGAEMFCLEKKDLSTTIDFNYT